MLQGAPENVQARAPARGACGHGRPDRTCPGAPSPPPPRRPGRDAAAAAQGHGGRDRGACDEASAWAVSDEAGRPRGRRGEADRVHGRNARGGQWKGFRKPFPRAFEGTMPGQRAQRSTRCRMAPDTHEKAPASALAGAPFQFSGTKGHRAPLVRTAKDRQMVPRRQGRAKAGAKAEAGAGADLAG